MRVVISGYFGYGNTGDEAILAGMLVSLRRETEMHVTVLSGNPDETERTHGVHAIRRGDLAAIIRALRDADGLISGGGSLLQDRTSFRPVAYYSGVMQLARLLGTPYVVYAQGLGPTRYAPNRALAAMALRGAAYVSLRDEASIALARRLGVPRRIELVSDPALALDPPSGGTGRHVAIAVRTWGGRRTYLTELREALADLSRDMPIVAVPMQDEVDREPSLAVIQGISSADVLPADATFGERLAAIGSAKVVIGMRLHALILAAGAGVPALAVSYDPKVDAFAARAGQPIVGTVREAMDPRQVAAAARMIVAADRGPYLERVQAMRATLHNASRATLDAFARAPSGSADSTEPRPEQ
jgi:polysaccharide pyruvyl transferase CsaB